MRLKYFWHKTDGPVRCLVGTKLLEDQVQNRLTSLALNNSASDLKPPNPALARGNGPRYRGTLQPYILN